MTTGNDDPHEAEEQPKLFQADRDKGAGGPGPKIAIGVIAIIGIALAVRSMRVEQPRPGPPAAPKPAPTPLTVPEGAMVVVPGATFKLGSEDGEPDEKPITEVTVNGFELDAVEVTVAAYEKCVTAGKCTAPDTGMYCNWKKPGRGAHPINCIDWEQATAYCAFVGKRLPSEDEWELAARGVEGRKFPWKQGLPGPNLCWNGEGNDQGRGQRQGTCPVASYPSGQSAVGALDMAGNVWEWTSSAYCPYDQRGCSSDKRVIRGGSWSNLDPAYVRSQDRAKEPPKARPDNVGARCARSPS